MRAVHVAILAATLAALGAPAFADSIDGHWCSQDGRRLEIAGPSIITPAGVRMTGNYDRHGFDFIAPPADRAAGQRVEMVLMGEMAVRVRAGTAEPETWNRCAPPVSLLPWPENNKRTGNG